jgi:hypothetical protein
MKRISILGSAFVPVAALCFFFAGAANARAADCPISLNTSVSQQGSSGATGHAALCVNDDGLKAKMKVTNLVPGNAYTVWFIYFDNPAACTVSGCAPGDLTAPLPDATHPTLAPAGVFGRMDSAIADEDGEARFSAKLQNFKVSKGSLIWLFVFTHGPASTDNQERARQLLTPEAPVLGAPGLGFFVRKGFGAGLAVFNIPI